MAQHKFDNLNNFLSECQKFVGNIEQYTGDDPLLPWYRYLQWMEENFMIDFKHETIFDHILAACLCKFENDKRYKQDRRFIKLFIKFIHFQEDQDALYETMVANGVGNKVADLYINWAFYFYMKQEYEAAERIFRRGIDARSEPSTLLKEAHTNFGFSMSQDILYKDDVKFQQEQQVRVKKQLQKITTLCMNEGYDADCEALEFKSMVFTQFDKKKLENYCVPFASVNRIVAGQTQHSESFAQNLMDSARKMRRNQNQNVKIPSNRLHFNENDDDIGVGGSSSSDSQILKPIPLPSNQNMYEKGIRIGKNYPRKNRPQNIGESRAYVDPEMGTNRRELPGYDKLMLIPATNVAFSPEELTAYRWFKRHGISNAFTIEQDRVWATGYGIPIRCADIFTPKNFPQTEWNLPRIAHYYLDDNHVPYQLMCNMSELYPYGCSEEFSLEEIMWRKRKAKLAQSQANGGVVANKGVERKFNRTNSMEKSSKLSPIIEMDLDGPDDALERPDCAQQKVTVAKELPSKKRKSSIFATFDGLNDTCNTQMFGNLLHRSVISTPNAKIRKCDANDGDLTTNQLNLFTDETSDSEHPIATNRNEAALPQKSHGQKQFAIYEDSITVTRDMKQLKSIENDGNANLTNGNKENVFLMENRMKLERSKLATNDMRRTEITSANLLGSQKKLESTVKHQNQQSKCESLPLSTVQQNQLQQPQQPPSANQTPFEIIIGDETQRLLVEPLKKACEIFEALIVMQGPSVELKKDLDEANERLAIVLNSITDISGSSKQEPNNCSVFEKPTAIANATSSSPSTCSKTNNMSQKVPNQSQYYELLDTTEEFEALEAQCASPPKIDATIMTSIKSIDQKLSQNQPSNKSTANRTIDKTLNIECAKIEAKENHKRIVDDQNAITRAADNDDDNDDDAIGKSIYVPQPELKFDDKDADWHEVTVFLESKSAKNNEYKAEEIDMNETRQRIDTHMLNMKDLNPFDPQLQKDVLIDIGFADKLNGDNDFMCTLVNIVKPLRPKSSIEIGKKKYKICKLIGEGAYGKVFTAECTKTKQTYAFKQQRPPNLWEYYVCLEIHNRIEHQAIRNGLMTIDFAVIGNNATIYASKFAKHGTLLDVCHKIQRNTSKNIDECIIMILVKQMFTVLEHFHKAKFIHADIKPDNFLLMDKLSLDYTNPEIVVQLIDFGQSIDLQYFSNHVFWAKVRTEHFVCTEMMDDKPWTYHCDFFCLASTIYTMVAGKYMIVKRNKATNLYKPQKLPRYVNAQLWDDIFDQLINIPNLTKLPSLSQLNKRLDAELNAIGSKKIHNAIRKFNQALDQ